MTETLVRRRVSLAEWNGPSRRPDSLDKDPEGTVAKANGAYFRVLGADPHDRTGAVARLRQITFIVTREAERRRVEKDTADTRKRRSAVQNARPWPLKELLTDIWYGFPFTGERPFEYPKLENETYLSRGEMYHWAEEHKEAGKKELIDHLASLIPPDEGETYEEWHERLKARRARWSEETDEVVVNKGLFPQKVGETYLMWIRRLRSGNPSGRRSIRIPSVRLRPVEPQSPGTSESHGGSRRRSRRARPSPEGRP